MKRVILSMLAVSALVFTSCSDDEPVNQGPDVNVPTLNEVVTGSDFTREDNGDYKNDYINNYATLFTRGGESTVSYGGQTTRLKQAKIIGSSLKTQTSVADIRLMFEGQDVAGTLQSAGFSDASLNGTTKVVRAKSSSSIGLFGSNKNTSGQGKTNVEALDAFITGHQAVLTDWTTAAAAGQAGRFQETGSTSYRYVDAKGRELDQLFTKSLSGALAYDQTINQYFNRLDNENGDNVNGTKDYRKFNDEGTVVEGKSYTTMEHHWDESFGYIFGNTSGQNLIYKYIDNVDKLAKFAGVEKQIFEAFVLGRIAISNKDYTARDTQVALLREKLGLIVAVRAVNYLSAGAKIIDAVANGTGKREDAFHDICEGYGFVNSLRYLVKADGTTKIFTDAEVDGYLADLNAGNGLWDVTPTKLRDIADSIAGKNVGGLSWTLDDVNP
ncbi:MAG: DUF4856 domain-containing protein [Tenacibaculum sp.]